MFKKFRKLFSDVVRDDLSKHSETENKGAEDKSFETPPMDEYLEENQTADEL